MVGRIFTKIPKIAKILPSKEGWIYLPAMPSGKKKKMRADELLVERGLASSRSEAKSLLLAGKVHSPTDRIDKAGKEIPIDTPLTVERPPRFVSRGGEKLEGILEKLNLNLDLDRALDVGASTGGFTDCLLQHGVKHMVCLDVGRNQLHHKIRSDARVTNIEQYNARNLEAGDLPYSDYPLIVIDVSFISLRLILPPVWKVLAEKGHLLCLVKPQFEADKKTMDQCRGVIKDPALSQAIATEIKEFALDSLENCKLIDFQPSVIQGTDGNQEFLLAICKSTIS